MTRERIPLAIPNVGPLEGEYLSQCVEQNFVSTVGPFVDRLEIEIAQRHGSGRGVAVAAGTMGLHIALRTLGVEDGDLVICPSFTFIASANAISHAGAVPWLLDVDENSWALSPVALKKALESQTQRTEHGVVHVPTGKRVSCIMPVYTLGTVPQMDEINGIAKLFDIPVVADAAAAIGVKYKDRTIGELADLTVFSFNGNKTITTGGGGMVIGRDEEKLARVKHLTTTARVSANYDHDEVGWNYRMTNLEAAVGCAQLKRLDDFISAKRRIRDKYDRAFGELNFLEAFPLPEWSESTCWFSGIVLDSNTKPGALEVCKLLNEMAIDARPFWKPVHLQKPYANSPKEALNVTESLWDRIVTLPCSTSLSDEDQNYVIESVKKILC